MTGPAQQTRRRLYRSRTDRMLGGVAGGLGNYFDVDPVLVRLAWVALAFAGIGVIAYIVAWIVVPQEPTGTLEAIEPTAAATPSVRRGNDRAGARIVFGSILIAVGGLLLLDWVVPDIDRLLWPAAIIAVGAGLLVYGARR